MNFIMLRIYGAALDRLRLRLNMYLVVITMAIRR